jgi:hypothetical protein
MADNASLWRVRWRRSGVSPAATSAQATYGARHDCDVAGGDGAMYTLFGVANPVLFFGGTGLFVLAIVMYDRRSRGRVHPVTRWGGLALMLSFPGRLALGKTDLWLNRAAWLIR